MEACYDPLGARPSIMHREPIGSGTCGLIANNVVAQSISGSATEGMEGSKLRYSTFDNFVGGNTLIRVNSAQ